MKTRARYTPDMDLFLRQNYGQTMSIDECAARLNTTKGSVAARVHRLREKDESLLPPKNTRYDGWDEESDDYLYGNWGLDDQIGTTLNRTPYALKKRAYIIGASKIHNREAKDTV